MQERQLIFEGVANLSPSIMKQLSRHKYAKKEPDKYGGVYFVKAYGSMRSKILFRYRLEDVYGNHEPSRNGAFFGPCFIHMYERYYDNGVKYFTLDVSKREDELTDMFVEIVEGPSQYRHSVTTEVVKGLDITGHMSVQIVQK